jgi:hypothetical protein
MLNDQILPEKECPNYSAGYHVLNATMEKNITHYSQIKKEFESVCSQVTSQLFNANVRVLNSSEMEKYCPGRHAMITRLDFWFKDLIRIESMPVYNMFILLSHEAGHSINPYLERSILDIILKKTNTISLTAEETKAALFEMYFNREMKNTNFPWLDKYLENNHNRLVHTLNYDAEYSKYYSDAIAIFQDNSTFSKGVQCIVSDLEKKLRF